MNVPAMAKALEVNPTAAHQQIAILQRQGLVAMSIVRRPKGRPTHLWSLTEKAEGLFPQAYGSMALSLLRAIRAAEGDLKIDILFALRTRELAARYRKRLSGKSPIAELARIREGEGYMARPSRQGLIEQHCPIAAIAREFPQACRWEQKLFERVLGYRLDRTEHIASGGRACVYRPKGRP
jgi:predicted ArsR family transcriptional regulator